LHPIAAGGFLSSELISLVYNLLWYLTVQWWAHIRLFVTSLPLPLHC
jgi:hypothetical protein